jgi:hypothetical protein
VQRSAAMASESPPVGVVGGQRNFRIVPCLDALRHGVLVLNCEGAFYRAMRTIGSSKRSRRRNKYTARATFGTPLARSSGCTGVSRIAKKRATAAHEFECAPDNAPSAHTSKAYEDEHTARHQ